MDIPISRPERRVFRAVALFVVLGAATSVVLGLSLLKTAAPTVDRGAVWVDTVKRGDLTREVRASGTLVPRDMRWVTAFTAGRVEQVFVRAGARVDETTIIIEISDPQTLQAAHESEWRLHEAEADYESLRAELDSNRLDTEAAAAKVQSEREQLLLRAEADHRLMQEGIIASLTAQLSRSAADDAARRLEIEKRRLAGQRFADEMKLGAERAKVEQIRAFNDLQQERRRMLQVRPGMRGVVQQINVETGQSTSAGALLARIAAGDGLDAQLRVAEGEASEIREGQKVTIDTHQGILVGYVSRIDPAVREGSVLVDVSLPQGSLPNLRADLSVDGSIQLAKLNAVLFVARPAQARERSTVALFRIIPGSKTARRVQVNLGSASSKYIEIKQGLKAGDQVIVSDTSAWSEVEELSLKD